MILIRPKELITVKVDYYMPNYTHIINEFICQYDDFWPEIPRVHKFLLYWKNNIEATISGVYVINALNNNWRFVDVIV